MHFLSTILYLRNLHFLQIWNKNSCFYLSGRSARSWVVGSLMKTSPRKLGATYSLHLSPQQACLQGQCHRCPVRQAPFNATSASPPPAVTPSRPFSSRREAALRPVSGCLLQRCSAPLTHASTGRTPSQR